MEVDQGITLLGLLLITYGSIFAAMSSPAPQYQADGSVTQSGISDKKERIKMYKKQKRFPLYISLVGVGAVLQAIALFIPKG